MCCGPWSVPSRSESLELSLALRPASRAAPRLLEQSRFTDRLLEQSRLTDRLPERPLDSGRPLERAADFARPASVRYAEHGRLSSARTRTTAATRGRLLAPLAVERARTPNAVSGSWMSSRSRHVSSICSRFLCREKVHRTHAEKLIAGQIFSCSYRRNQCC